jgi:ribonuclease HII
LARLVERLREALSGDEALVFCIDKHGGRNYYAAMLQDAVPDGMIVASEESAGRSIYTALGLGRKVRFTFEPRAEAAHFCVAAASMISKYLREALMHDFNRFWRAHVPHLKPTAGYPGDAVRFLRDIEPAIQRLGIDKAAVWRRR